MDEEKKPQTKLIEETEIFEDVENIQQEEIDYIEKTKPLGKLVFLVAFTAIMLISSTYAWFSAQKTVTVGNLEGKVNVAEGIEISLDAVNWSQEIDFSEYKVTDGDVGAYENLAKVYGAVNHNILPTELVPVSTTGKTYIDNNTTSGKEIAFYNGKNTDSIKLSDIIQTDPTEASVAQSDFAGYYAIDLFLRNSSKLGDSETQGTAMETLQLNTNSKVELVSSGSTETGLQNTVRVALALYQPDTSDSTTQSVAVTETDQAKILAATTGATATVKDVAIWEPNADQHVSEIITNNNKITWTDADAALYLTTEVDSKTGTARLDASKKGKFVSGEMTPTYALNSTAVGATIEDIYNWGGTVTTLEKQIALQTKKSSANYTTVDGGVRNLVSVTSSGADVYEYGTSTAVGSITAETGAEEFQIYKNQISRVRMYVWLEGQDVDCTNFA